MSARRKRGRRAPAPEREAQPKRIHSVPVTGENGLAPEESVSEAESELGVNDWVDPETGELAEGQSPPRLEDE